MVSIAGGHWRSAESHQTRQIESRKGSAGARHLPSSPVLLGGLQHLRRPPCPDLGRSTSSSAAGAASEQTRTDETIEIYVLRVLVQRLYGGICGRPWSTSTWPQLGGHQRPVAGPKEGRDRAPLEQLAVDVYLPVEFAQHGIESREVLGRRIGDEVARRGSRAVPPRVHRQAADQHEPNLRLDQPSENLPQPKRLRRQLFRALPVKVERNSLSARPSARLTASGRRTSSRICRRRDSSLPRQGSSGLCFFGSSLTKTA